MKTLDRYILNNFLVSVLMCTLVTLAIRVVADLFVNMDEFSELSGKLDIGWLQVSGYVFSYYAHRSLVFFQEMGGVILLMAALFSLARMNHTNELVAAMAGGMSLYRLAAPVLLVGMGFSLVGVLNQELMIPRVKDRLALSRDEAPGQKKLRVELISDDHRNIWYSRRFDQGAGRMTSPLVLARDQRGRQQAKIAADAAVISPEEGGWRMLNANMAVLANSRSRGALDSGFILTSRGVGHADASGKGQYDPADGMKISCSRVVGPDILIEPVFSIYAPPSGEKKLRLLGVMYASCAVFESHKRDSGYRLVGDPLLDENEIRSWRDFCVRLLSGEKLGPDKPLGRLWGRLDAGLRETVRRCVVDRVETGTTDRLRLISAINDTIISGDIANVSPASPVAAEAAPVSHISLADSIKAALLSGVLSSEFCASVLNRAALDDAMKAELIPSGGELLLFSGLTGEEIVLRQSGKWLDYMSSSELAALVRTGSAPDPAAASLAMHMRFTAPVSWVIMLLLGIPFVVSRERRLKSSTLLCLLLVGGFHASVFISRYLGDDLFELISHGMTPYCSYEPSSAWGPIIGAWLPIVIFVPVAVLLLESMHSMNMHDRNDTVTELLAAPGGRVRRRLFWRWACIILAVVLALSVIDLLWIGRIGMIGSIAAMLGGWPLLMLHFKRSHDRNRSGFFAMTPLIPLLVVGLIRGSVGTVLELNLAGWLFLLLFSGLSLSLTVWVIVETWFMPGDPGPNAYGHDPKDIDVQAAAVPPEN